ncbi:hypothetical protein HRR86_002702 [Exophiala dermatitidis]|nr:hypothetical protein HRR86_002702 [Exophiala dermatitidis]
MPPKKRKAASAKGTKTTDPDTSSVVLSPAGRPKRTSVSEPRYDFINHHRPSTTGKRGRPSGASSIARAAIHKSPAAATQNVVGRKRKRAGKFVTVSQNDHRIKGGATYLWQC